MTIPKQEIDQIVTEMQATSLFPINLDLSIKRVNSQLDKIAAMLNLLDTEVDEIDDLNKHLKEDLAIMTSSVNTIAQKTNLLLSAILQITTV